MEKYVVSILVLLISIPLTYLGTRSLALYQPDSDDDLKHLTMCLLWFLLCMILLSTFLFTPLNQILDNAFGKEVTQNIAKPGLAILIIVLENMAWVRLPPWLQNRRRKKLHG